MTGVHGEPCSVEEAARVLAERAKAGIQTKEKRKGFYKMYTDHALSAMKGAGLEYALLKGDVRLLCLHPTCQA